MSRLRVNLDEFDCGAIKRLVHGFYTQRQYPTIKDVLLKAKENLGFRGGWFSMRRILGELGFQCKKRDCRQYVIEQPHVITQRHTYLQQIRQVRKLNVNIVYTDETWVNSHHTNDYIWIDKSGKGGWKVPNGRGMRLIVVHAGGCNGLVEGAGLVFLSKTNSVDYHDEMNSEHYLEWMTTQLLPSLEEPSVIVLDNASYHNKQRDKAPTSNDRKEVIKKWLDKHNIKYEETDIKKTLLQLVKQHRPSPLYDEMNSEHYLEWMTTQLLLSLEEPSVIYCTRQC